jgi:chemotaxis protein CheD
MAEVEPRFNAPSVRLPPELQHLTRVVIRIGALYVSSTPVVLDTVLGSCISACLYDEEAKIGGMNHFMLPHSAEINPPTAARYGVQAMELLITRLMKMGADRRRLKAKVFGGGHVLQTLESADSVPQKNIEFIRKFMATERIPVLHEDVGGRRTRRVLFLPHLGEVHLKRLQTQEAMATRKEEEGFLSELDRKKTDGDATLF